MAFIVAIDGPAGSGKGTITKLVGKKLNLVYIDTGAMYRSVAVYSLRNNINFENENAIKEMFENIKIELKNENDNLKVYLNKEDITKLIRTPQIDEQVKIVATIQPIRRKMVDLMREIAKSENVIMEGRDIGTVVFPNANVKIYLDAKVEERARRRYKENCEKNIDCSYEKILEDMIERDRSDLTKGGLRKADDAIAVDSSNMSIEEVTNKIIEIIEDKRG